MRGIELPLLTKDFEVKETLIQGNVSGNWVQLVGQNPTRWGMIVNLTSGSSRISTNPNPGSSGGLSFPAQTPVYQFNFRDYGALLTVPWYYLNQSSPFITVIEILYKPQGY